MLDKTICFLSLVFAGAVYIFFSPKIIFAAASTCQELGVSINPTHIPENSTPPVNFTINGGSLTPGDWYKMEIETQRSGFQITANIDSSWAQAPASGQSVNVQVQKNAGIIVGVIDNTLDVVPNPHIVIIQSAPNTSKGIPGKWSDFCTGLSYTVGFDRSSCQSDTGSTHSFQTNASITLNVNQAPTGKYAVCFGDTTGVVQLNGNKIDTQAKITIGNDGSGQTTVKPFTNTPQSGKFSLVTDGIDCNRGLTSVGGLDPNFCYSPQIEIKPSSGKPPPITCNSSVSGTTANITCNNFAPGGSYMNTVLFSNNTQAAQLSINADRDGNGFYTITGLSPDNYTYQITDSSASRVFSGKFSVASPGAVPPALPCTGAGCTKAGGVPCDDDKNNPGIGTAIGCIHTSPQGFVKDMMTFVIGISGGLAFLMMLLGAFQMLTSAGNPDTLHAGQERLTSAIIGLLLVIFAVLLLQIIGVSILNIPGFTTK